MASMFPEIAQAAPITFDLEARLASRHERE